MVQRVSTALVRIEGKEHSRIGTGLLVLVGVEQGDTEADAGILAKKVIELRIFEDETARMNRSVVEVGGAVLAVSQFTLLGDCRKGRRPSFDKAAKPDEARGLYERFVSNIATAGVPVETGVFREMMDVESTNSGPVTLLLDTRKTF